MLRTLSLLALTALAASSQQQAVVKLTNGTLQGIAMPEGQKTFRGIPYAQPPVGNLRWRGPQPPLPWKGVRDATRFSPACIQDPHGTDNFLVPLAKLYGNGYSPRRLAMSEDCLYLNIWTPQSHDTPAPVMVWIHGGSNRFGAASEDAYDGAALARHGVLVVSINYRLGTLGFFSHPELTRESPHHASGNYGLLDQVAALEWVRANIAAFGGDASRVTIFGESAGSIDIGLLLCSPLSKGLFARAIMESGPVFLSPRAWPLKRFESAGEQVAKALGVEGRNVIERLRSLPPEAVAAKGIEVSRTVGNPAAVADGWFLRESPGEIFASGRQSPADFIIGNNGREMSAFRAAAASRGSSSSGAGDGAAAETMKIFYGRSAALVFGLYMINNKLQRTEAADSWLNDVMGTCPGMAMASLHARAGRRAYVYQFNREIPGKGQSALGSFHSLEIPFVFGTLQAWNWLPFEQSDRQLSATMQSYWTNFAKTGNPNGPTLPGWREFDHINQNSLNISKTGQIRLRSGSAPAFCDVNANDLAERLR